MAALCVALFLLPAISKARAAGDPAFAKAYRPAAWASQMPGTRLQITVMTLGAFLLMIPVGKAMGWARMHVPFVASILPHSLDVALAVGFVIAVLIEVAGLAVIRAITKPAAKDDSLI